MKFEIDNTTGFLLIEPENGIIPSKDNAKIYRDQLETILQAVNKTQEKLENKQIQNIQNSKNICSVGTLTISPQPKFEINGDNIDLDGENVSISATDSEKDAHLTIKCTLNHEKIERNQKKLEKIRDLLNLKQSYGYAYVNDYDLVEILNEGSKTSG